jgi:hypothetical protein
MFLLEKFCEGFRNRSIQMGGWLVLPALSPNWYHLSPTVLYFLRYRYRTEDFDSTGNRDFVARIANLCCCSCSWLARRASTQSFLSICCARYNQQPVFEVLKDVCRDADRRRVLIDDVVKIGWAAIEDLSAERRIPLDNRP